MKKQLMKLSRADLDKLASEKYSVAGASELATKGDVVDAILATDKAKEEIKALEESNNEEEEKELEIPEYVSNKVVRALKIKKIDRHPRKNNNTAVFTPKNKDYKPFVVDRHFYQANKLNMIEGGYYVIYEDGSAGFMGAKEFKSEFQKA